MDQDSFFFPQTGGWLLGFPQLGFSKKNSPPLTRFLCSSSIDPSINHTWAPHGYSTIVIRITVGNCDDDFRVVNFGNSSNGKLVVVVRGFCDFGSFWCYYSVSEICSCWFFKARSEASFKSFLGTSTLELPPPLWVCSDESEFVLKGVSYCNHPISISGMTMAMGITKSVGSVLCLRTALNRCPPLSPSSSFFGT